MPRRPAGPRNESGGKKAQAQKARRRKSTSAKRSKATAAHKPRPRSKRPTSNVSLFAPERSAPPATDAAGHARPRPLDDVAGLSARQLHEVYRCLFETRRLEEHLVALYRQNQVVGGVYRSLGQEATAIGCTYALRNGDIIQPLIRDLGAALVHGATPIAMLRQYMARATGPTGGRDLNTHFSDPSAGMLGPVSMLGAMVPALAGCLLATRMRGEKRVGLCFIGDGGSSTGAFYEGINFAAVQRLPLIGVIEANHYAYSTPTDRQVPDGDLVRRARGFGVYVAHLDGNDVLACYEAVRDARDRGLAGEGPTLLVADTYRRRGHAEHDNQAYVPEGEIDDWGDHNDPVDRYVRFLLDGGHATQAELDAIREAVEAELDEARAQAVSEGFPDPATATTGVYDDGERPWPTIDTWFRGGPPHRESP